MEAQLPPEMWVCVFSYLSTEDKHAVRTSCRHMKSLVDHPALWRDYTVVLSKLRRYTNGFWDTLNRRRLTRVAVHYLQRKEWRDLVKFLPGLTTIFFDYGGLETEECLSNLSMFPQLHHLGVWNALGWEGLPGTDLVEPLKQLKGRLTHLSVCNVDLPCTVGFINTVAQLENLQYLLFHQWGDSSYDLGTERPVPREPFHNLLLHLKKLKHLSWGMKGEPADPLPDDYLSPMDPEQPGCVYGGLRLSSLELVDYPECILPENALRSLSSLRTLTVRFCYFTKDVKRRLRSWLTPLHNLQTLTIIGVCLPACVRLGQNSLAAFLSSIPPTVTRLTLRVNIRLKDMDVVAPKISTLEHLEITQNHSSGSLCKRIPTLFPHLRTLRIRFCRREPKKDLLCLHKMRQLVQLELLVENSLVLNDSLDRYHWPSPAMRNLISQLRELSENRITVITARQQLNPLWECDCVWDRD